MRTAPKLGNVAAAHQRSGDVLTTLRGLDVRHGDLAAAAILFGAEGDLLTLRQRHQAGALERGCMNEYVIPPVFWGNEAVSFLRIVEFNSTAIHGASSSEKCSRARARRGAPQL